MEERRIDMKNMADKFEELCKTVHAIKGNQGVIKSYLETQFGGLDLVGTPTEGKITRDLRELNDKVKIQNGRVTKSEEKISKLENWRWYVLGIAGACTFIITMAVAYHK